MAAVAATWVVQWAGQLAGVSDTVLEKVPENDEWLTIRHFLKNTSRLLRKGDIAAGIKGFGQILPYVQVAMFITYFCMPWYPPIFPLQDVLSDCQ